MADDTGFTEVTQEPVKFIDATPNEEYPLRILRAYRENCNCLWADSSDPDKEVTNPLFKLMNDAQRERASILDRSIDKLESNT